MYTSATRPGPYRLYRRDNDSNYSVQTYWTGARWRLYGYNGDTEHADTHVGYSDSTGSVAWSNVSGRPTAVSSFTNDSGYQTSSGSVNYASSAGSVAWSNVSGKPTTLSGLTDDRHMYGNNGIVWGMGAASGYVYTLSNGAVDDTSTTFSVPSTGWWSFNNVNIHYRAQRYQCTSWLSTTAYVIGSFEIYVGAAWYPISMRWWDASQTNALHITSTGGATRTVSTKGTYYQGGLGLGNATQTSFDKPYYLTAGATLRLRMMWSPNTPTEPSGTGVDLGTTPELMDRPPYILSMPSSYNYQWRAYPSPQTFTGSSFWFTGAGVEFSASRVG